MLSYYCIVRQVLKRDPHLKQCLTRCKECHIFFITDFRNKTRTDLRCPFGCRQHHRKENMARRSKAYYQTDIGKEVKKIQNLGRNRQKTLETYALESQITKETSSPLQSLSFDEMIIDYLRNVLSLIENSILSKNEILILLQKKWRRHSIDKEETEDIILKYS